MAAAQSRFGIGLIGVGRHGARYLHHLVENLPEVRLAAVCRKRSNQEPIPGLPSGVRLYTDFHELIADSSVQAVVVVTPASLCREICLNAVEAGKPLLVEKPLATTGEEARAMVAAAERAKVLLMTAQTMRFDPILPYAKEQLGRIGAIRYGLLTSRIEMKASAPVLPPQPRQRGTMIETGVHLLDMLRFITGQEVVDARCDMAPHPAEAPETMALAQLRTEGGIHCLVEVARVGSGRVGRAEWVGADGQLSVDWVQRTVTCLQGVHQPEVQMIPQQPTILATLRAFLQAIDRNSPPPVTGLDGCRAVEIADACYESASAGGTIVPVRRDR